MTTIPDLEALLLDRFEICNNEIKAFSAVPLRRVFRMPPASAIDVADLPALAIRIGPMRSPIPRSSPGRIEVARDYYLDLIVASLQNAQDLDSKGVEALTKAALWPAIIRDYYLTHPRLHTDGGVGSPPTSALGELSGLMDDISFQDSGMAELPGPGGVLYAGIRYTFGTVMQARVVASRLS